MTCVMVPVAQVVTPMKDYLADLNGTRPAPAGSEPGELGVARQKLLKFLDFSVHYTPQKMISTFLAFEGLYEERAILLGRIGRHDQALSIYAYKLDDPAKAEQYCERQFELDSEGSADVFRKLLVRTGGSQCPFVQMCGYYPCIRSASNRRSPNLHPRLCGL